MWQKPVISIDDTTGPLDEVYFPSVTVCNMNQFRMSQVNRMGLDPKKEPDVFRTFLTKYLDSLAGEDSGLDARQRNARRLLEDYEKLGQNNITWADELAYIQGNLSEAGIEWDETSEPFIVVKGTAQVCPDLLLHTKWNGEDKYSYSSHVSYTDFGYCCRIFPTVELSEPRMVRTQYNESGDWVLPPYKEKFWDLYKLRRGSKNGIENGLMLLMDVESFENAQYPSKAEGLIVALSGDLERPLVGSSGTFVEAGSANLISLQVFGTNTTEEAVDTYSPDTDGTSVSGTRTCYADKDNFQPKYFNQDDHYLYSMSNCLYSAMVTSIEKHCNCTPFFHSIGDNFGFCLERDLTCVENRTKSWGSKKAGLDMAEDKLGGPLKQCHDNCDTQELRVVTSRSGYPKKRTLHLTEDFCLIVSKMRKICKDKARKKAFEDYYADLHNQHPLPDKCNIVLDEHVADHCPDRNSSYDGDDILYSRYSNPSKEVRAAEKELEKAVATYAEDNLVVVRVFLKDPYYQKLTRAQTMSTITFLGSAGGWLGLCCGLSIISLLEIGYHGLLFVIAIWKGEHVHN